MELKDIRIFLLLLVGIFLGQTINPMPVIIKDLMYNKYFQFLIIFTVTLDIYDFKKIIKSAVIAITILLIFELLRNFDN
jgi:hypothetical protein